MTIDQLLSNKDSTGELAKVLDTDDIKMLIGLLNEKDDKLRYAAFLTLQNRSKIYPDVYTYWDTLSSKLTSDNSYWRSIGIMLIAENIKWDTQNKFDDIAEEYLSHCDDEKFITARQTIHSINIWITYKEQLFPMVTEKLTSIDVSTRKNTQRKLLIMDILTVLSQIQKVKPDSIITNYVLHVTTGGYLDAKSINLANKMF